MTTKTKPASQPTIYERNGHKDRKDYLEALCAERGWPKDEVIQTAYLLGPEEDFDGLISLCEDYFG